jgi:hypothetical protein
VGQRDGLFLSWADREVFLVAVGAHTLKRKGTGSASSGQIRPAVWLGWGVVQLKERASPRSPPRAFHGDVWRSLMHVVLAGRLPHQVDRTSILPHYVEVACSMEIPIESMKQLLAQSSLTRSLKCLTRSTSKRPSVTKFERWHERSANTATKRWQNSCGKWTSSETACMTSSNLAGRPLNRVSQRKDEPRPNVQSGSKTENCI